MKPLFRYQLQYNRSSFIFVGVFFLLLAIILQENLFITPERLASYALIVTIIPNFYAFLTQNEFRRTILTMPINVKDIVKAVYGMFLLYSVYVCVIAILVGAVLEVIFDSENRLILSYLLTLPSIWAVLGVRYYTLIRTKIDALFGIEMFAIFGMGILFVAPSMAIIFSLPSQYFSIYVAVYIFVCIVITYYTYTLSLKNADKLYVIVRNEVSDEFLETIHREQMEDEKQNNASK